MGLELKNGICEHCKCGVSYKYSRKVLLCRSCNDKRWRNSNKERCSASVRKCWQNNREKYLKTAKVCNKRNLTENLDARLRKNLRARISNILRGRSKSGSAVNDLGCSVTEFKQYIESKWQLNMSWDNYGFDGWHIDHIKPLVSFNLSDPEQFKQACHYTNLQPLWQKDNFSKGGR